METRSLVWRRSRSRTGRLGAFVACTLTGAVAGFGGEQPPLAALRHEATPELRLAVERGFRYLIRNQNKSSGAFSDKYPVAIDALAGLAFLAAGHNNRQGPYAREFQAALDHLLSYQERRSDGYFDDGESQMYGHGFATLFLAELYGMAGAEDERIHKSLERAVRLIETSQCRDGGWDYHPFAPDRVSDTSITVCQTMALRAARNLGIQVNTTVVERARSFILKAQNSDGGFAYRPNIRIIGDFLRESAIPRSAAGVCVLLSLGDYESQAVRKGFEYLRKHYTDFNTFPYYTSYYCSLAMFQAGGAYWREYFDYIRGRLLRKQRADGSWGGSIGGPGQATAMALIVLQLPYRYLPISER